MSYMYSVEYARNELRKQFQAGFLITTPETRWLWLKDSAKVTIRKGVVADSVIQGVRVGATFTAAGYEIRVVEAIDKPLSVTTLPRPSSSEVQQLNNGKPMEKATSEDKANISQSAKPPVVVRPSLDPLLLAVMRPHQVSAARFLLARLLGEDVIADDVDRATEVGVEVNEEVKEERKCLSSTSSGDASTSDDTDNVRSTSENSSGSSSSTGLKLLITGAILADDMGTGKTLTGLSVLWALIRHGRSKGIVVCPSSLVENWEREAKKWLPHTLGSSSCGLFVSARDAESKVGTFCSSASSVRPLLVISYELFRTYAEQFNRVSTLDVLMCDEGHRLKNACGTQTTLALGNCIAMRRLVLTGTPIQNNLDELYAVVNFASPGYLGTLQEFKSNYGDAIEGAKGDAKDMDKDKDKGKARKTRRGEEKASAKDAATQSLRLLLSKILLRRTRDTILKAILPPRTDFLLHCGMTSVQQNEYLQLCEGLLKEGLTVTSPSSESTSSTPAKKRKGANGKAVVSTSSAASLQGILPALLQLRLCANSSSSCSPTAFAYTPEGRRAQADFLLAQSGKMQVLDLLLGHIRAQREKVVVVSNFTSALDDVQALAMGHGWHCLRIDGSVAADKRQRQVNHFNSPDSPFFLMLLSAKAGGVGLNLVGGSRLVMLDPDWNPATDAQCMGRVWRDGQTRPVFIYRLISCGTIEEMIVKRQLDKGALASVIAVQGGGSTASSSSAAAAPSSSASKSPEAERQGDADESNVLSHFAATGCLVEDLVLPRGQPFLLTVALETTVCARQAKDDVRAFVELDPVLGSVLSSASSEDEPAKKAPPIVEILKCSS